MMTISKNFGSSASLHLALVVDSDAADKHLKLFNSPDTVLFTLDRARNILSFFRITTLLKTYNKIYVALILVPTCLGQGFKSNRAQDVRSNLYS